MTEAKPPLAAADPSGKTLLIEGWRGINQSFAIVNQNQILGLQRLPGLTLRHRDLSFALPQWNRTANPAGFSEADQAAIDGLAVPRRGERIDGVYRIASPFRRIGKADRRRTVTFMVTEIGLSSVNFEADRREGRPIDLAPFTRDDNRIATPSAWSRDRLVDFGFPGEKITLIPHGVDGRVFHPLAAAERLHNRAALGIEDATTVFLNIGLSSWNKGIDLLLIAFARLRSGGRNVRLILKDQKELYGRSVQELIRTVGTAHPALLAADTLGAISVISSNMALSDLRLLYGVADAYVAPYRGEGFNFPVLESIACGTPAIVTAGGATDAFCHGGVAVRVPGVAAALEHAATGLRGRYIEPDLDTLTDAMAAFTAGRPAALAGFGAASLAVAQRFSWANAARAVAAATTGEPAPAEAQPAGPPAAIRSIGQKDVLDLIATMRPLAMERTAKVRVGNAYDGGYVLPAAALECEAVLSIGVGPDVSFDIALAERGARIAQFDHTVEKPPADHANCTFYRLGWGPESRDDLLSFDDILARFNRLGRRRSLLKFDIEGAEYDVLNRLDPEALRRFDVIVCEIHQLDRLLETGFYETARRCLDTLTTFHAPVHLHANNYAPVSMVAGIPVPTVLELSFLRRDLDTFGGPSGEPIPGPLDRPNHPYRVDICMNAF